MSQRLIYWVQAGDTDMVKIGHSTGPSVRMQLMQTACPLELKLVRVEVGGIAAELALQKYYRNQGLHIRGEWFHLSADQIHVCLTDIANFPINTAEIVPEYHRVATSPAAAAAIRLTRPGVS